MTLVEVNGGNGTLGDTSGGELEFLEKISTGQRLNVDSDIHTSYTCL